jgi:hypothetical protein
MCTLPENFCMRAAVKLGRAGALLAGCFLGWDFHEPFGLLARRAGTCRSGGCGLLRLDWSIAEWVHAHKAVYRSRDIFEPLTHLPDPFIPLGAAAFLVLACARSPAPRHANSMT